MNKTIKRFLPLCLVAGLCSTTTAFAERINMDLFYHGKHHAYNASEIQIYLDGKKYTDPNMPAVSIDGRTMLPMRGISQEMGCSVTWNEDKQQVYAVSDTHAIVFEIGSKTGYKNGEPFTMDVPPMIVNDRTMLPVRAFAKALDLDVVWEDPTRTVKINTKTTQKPETKPEQKPETKPETKPEPKPDPKPQVPTGKLTKIITPTDKNAKQEYVISGKFTRYEETYVDDQKVVLDFYGAENGLAGSITDTKSNFVKNIRTAQHKTDSGEVYTRIVFDLTGKKEHTVKADANNTQLTLSFGATEVNKITVANNGNMDTVAIHSNGAVGASVSTLSNPKRVVIDIPGAKVGNIPEQIDTSKLHAVKDVRTSMMDGGIFRVVVEAEDDATTVWNEVDQKLVVTVTGNDLENVTYNAQSNVLRLAKQTPININQIQHTDAYLNGYYEMLLPGNYESVYGSGIMNLNTPKVKSIEFGQKGGQTYIRFQQNSINAYTIQDVGDAYEIAVKNPKEVYSKVVLVDAGHGGNDPGTSGNGVIEKNATLAVALQVEKYLKDHSDIKVYMTRTDNRYPANSHRAKTANDIADLMVSIHMNSGPPSASGTETLYTPHRNETGATLTSLQAAQMMQKTVSSVLGTKDRGLWDRPDILILNSTKVPAILVEVCFVTNVQNAQMIATPAGQQKAGEAIAQGIINIMNSYKLR